MHSENATHHIRQEEAYWVYNPIDSKHNGVLTVAFSPSGEHSEGVVRSIEYTGDEVSAPTELPYLNAWSSANVIEKYGAQMVGRAMHKEEPTFAFRNGVYVNMRNVRVFRYGIFTVPQPSTGTNETRR